MALLISGFSTFSRLSASWPVSKYSNAAGDAVLLKPPGAIREEDSLAMSGCRIKNKCNILLQVKDCVLPAWLDKILCGSSIPSRWRKIELIFFYNGPVNSDQYWKF